MSQQAESVGIEQTDNLCWLQHFQENVTATENQNNMVRSNTQTITGRTILTWMFCFFILATPMF